MLPLHHRLRTQADFTSAVRGRGGVRAGSDLLVVHVVTHALRAEQPPRVGFVVSKAVGNAVTRNRTKRRLRALMAARLDGIPSGTDLVLRARPEAASTTSVDLALGLDTLLDKAFRRMGRRR